MKSWCLLALLGSAAACAPRPGKPVLPLGTQLPVKLGREIRAGKTAVQTKIRARTTQRIPVAKGVYLPAGTEVDGTVVASSALPASVVLRFDTIVIAHHPVPIQTRCLAVASFLEVSSTAEPASMAPDRANPDEANWTTRQVGGDEVVREDWKGPVINTSSNTVGFADYEGVYASPAQPDELPEAVGVFSTTARGMYGYGESATLASAGGTMTVTAKHGLVLHGNDHLLLQFLPEGNGSLP